MTGLSTATPAMALRAGLKLGPAAVGGIWGVLLTLIPLYDYFLRPNYEGSSLYHSVNYVVPAIAFLSTATLMAAVGFSFVAAWVIGVDYRRQSFMAALAMTLVVLAALSGMTANAPVMPLVILTLFLAYVMAVNFGALNHWEAAFQAFAAAAVVVFTLGDILALTSRDVSWGRLGGHAGPNYWGMVSGAALMLCLCLKPAWLRIPVILVALLTLYETQARGSIVAATAGAAAMGAISLMRLPARHALLIAVVAAIAAVLVFIFGSDFISHKILLLDDQYRGAASNGSGRLIGWAETINVIAAHPLFGVGLKQHEQYLHAVANAHNAYLAAAAEQGLIGLTVYLALMVGASVRAVFKVFEQFTRQRIVLVGYLIYLLMLGLFEQVSYQTGNSFALIGMIAAALSWRAEPRLPTGGDRLAPASTGGRTARGPTP